MGARMHDLAWERRLVGPVAGVDEAGRGPLAGPVVAAAVVFRCEHAPASVADSKALSAEQRRRAALDIAGVADVGIGVAEPVEIELYNIRGATLRAMARAILALPRPPASALIDGNAVPDIAGDAHAVVGGDRLCASIAAASIIAKTHRDRLIASVGARWPAFGFVQHKGYPTAVHIRSLNRLPPCPLHRRTFGPVRRALGD